MASEDLQIRIKAILESDKNVWTTLNQQIKSVESDLAKLSLQGKTASTEFKQLETTLHGLTQQKIQLRSQINGITQDLKGTHSGFSQLQNTMNGLKDSIMNVAKAFVSFEVVKKITSEIIEFGKSSLEVFEKNQISLAKLETGLNNVSSGNSLPKLVQQAKELSATTMFKKADIENAQALLTVYGMAGDQIAKTIPTILDVVAGMKKSGDTEASLDQVTKLLGKTNEAVFTGLTRYGIILTDNDKKMISSAQGMERTNIIVDLMKQKFGGFAEAEGKTFAGTLSILGHLWDETEEKVGGMIAGGLNPFLVVIKDIIPIVEDAIMAIINLGKGFLSDVQNILGITNSVGTFKNTLIALVQGGVNFLKQAFEYLKPAILFVIKAFKNFYDDNQDLMKFLGGFIQVLFGVGMMFVKLEMWIVGGILKALSWLIGAFRDVDNWFKNLFNTIANSSFALSFNSQLGVVIDSVKTFIGWIQSAVYWIGELFSIPTPTQEKTRDQESEEVGGTAQKIVNGKIVQVDPYEVINNKKPPGGNNTKKDKGSKTNPMSPDEQDIANLKLYIEQQKESGKLTQDDLNAQFEIYKQKYESAKADWESNQSSKEKWAIVKNYGEALKLINSEKKSLDDDLIKNINLQLEGDKLFHNLNEDDLKLNIKQVELELSLTTDLEEKIKLTKELITLKDELYTKQVKNLLGKNGDERQGYDIPEGDKNKAHDIWEQGDSPLDRIKKQAEQVKNAIHELAGAFGNFFKTIASGEGAGKAFKELLKGLLQSTLNFIQALLFAQIAKVFVDSTMSFGATLIKELPEIALATAGFEAAKGMIGALAEGGSFNSGAFLVGERGPELALMGKSGYMVNNQDLASLVSGNLGNKQQTITPVYISANMDGLSWSKQTVPQYKSYMKSKRVD